MAIWGGGPQALWQDKRLPTDCHGPSGLAMTAQRNFLTTNFGDSILGERTTADCRPKPLRILPSTEQLPPLFKTPSFHDYSMLK